MLEEIKSLNLPPYDVLLIGDGSGTIATKCSAWACWRHIAQTDKLELHCGSFSFGTNNFAELIPYIGVLWLDYYEKPIFPRHVCIVTDSEVTAKCGNGEYSRSSNTFLWKQVDMLQEAGYYLKWKHISRNSNRLSAACDKLAGQLRRETEKIMLTNLAD
jgi:ribonuclease HI